MNLSTFILILWWKTREVVLFCVSSIADSFSGYFCSIPSCFCSVLLSCPRSPSSSCPPVCVPHSPVITFSSPYMSQIHLVVSPHLCLFIPCPLSLIFQNSFIGHGCHSCGIFQYLSKLDMNKSPKYGKYLL